MAGKRTVSITWITPFETTMSVLITCASFTLTVPPLVEILTSWPLTVVAEDSFATFAAVTLPANTW